MTPALQAVKTGFLSLVANWRERTSLYRWITIGLLAWLSLPTNLVEPPDMGMDPSWMLALHLAAVQGKTFGQEFIFTYGPLGYLLIHAAVNKAALLLYDLFVLFSLLALYRQLLPAKSALLDWVSVMILALITKAYLLSGSSTVLFGVLCYWLWSVQTTGQVIAVVGALTASLILFFGKVNYGMVMLVLMPTYGLALAVLGTRRWIQSASLLVGFPVLLLLGADYLHVDLAGYLRAGKELIAGYNEAMVTQLGRSSLWAELSCPFQLPMGVEFAWPYLVAIILVAWRGRHQLVWREQLLLLWPLSCGLVLLFKNAFVRSDGIHHLFFYQGLPLLIAIWFMAWRRAESLRLLLILSLCYPLALLSARTPLSWTTCLEQLPFRYVSEVFSDPWRGGAEYLQRSLAARFPSAALPVDIRSTIGQSTVDILPWEASLAVVHGLNYQPRPIPQSYSAYTPGLDGLNARYLSGNNAPEYLLYTAAQPFAIDDRPSAWDESLTKRELLENYSYVSEFLLAQKVGQAVALKPANTFLLRRTPQARRLIPIRTNEVALQLDQTLPIPASTNLIFLTLQVKRSALGKIQSAAIAPSLLYAQFQYDNGQSARYRAILPILQTGVLVNRRVEYESELGHWLKSAAWKNPAISALTFSSAQPWAFQPTLTGQLVEYRLEPTEVGENLAGHAPESSSQ